MLAINDFGELFSWGCNDVGQLGLGDTTTRHRPTKIETIGKLVLPPDNKYKLKNGY